MNLLIGIIALLFFCCMFLYAILPLIQIRKSTECTTGTILKINEKIIHDSDTADITVYYYPVFEYYAEGEKIIKESDQGVLHQNLQEGDKVVVKYSPEHPKDAYLEIYEKDKFNRSILGMIAIAIMGIYIIISMIMIINK